MAEFHLDSVVGDEACRRRLNTGPPAPVQFWVTGAAVGGLSGWARDLGSIC
jgi:hypothetical protein